MTTKKKLYNIRLYSDNSLLEVEGEDVPNDYGMKLFVHKKTREDGTDLGYTVSDFWTGLSVMSNKDFYIKLTKKKAIELFHQRMEAYPQARESYAENVRQWVEKLGYANKE
jgi:hypothetical protein